MIYGLYSTRDSKIRYIGITINPEARLKQHLVERGDSAKARWLHNELINGFSVKMRMLVKDGTWDDEAKLIRRYADRLLNVTSACEIGEESRRAMRLKSRYPTVPEPIVKRKRKQRATQNIVKRGWNSGISKNTSLAITSDASRHTAKSPVSYAVTYNDAQGVRTCHNGLTHSEAIELLSQWPEAILYTL